jgi:hypothetical protein
MSIQTQQISSSEELSKFYEETFYFSYSSINKLLFSPRMFYDHYVLKQKEDTIDAHLVAGRALHCLLLESEERFNEEFIVMPGTLPGDNNRVIIDNIFNKSYLPMGNDSLELSDFANEILNQLLVINLHQSLKTDAQRIDKILTEQNKEYFNFLKAKQNKTVIDQKTLDACKESVECLKNNNIVKQLLQLDQANNPDIRVLNEQALRTEPYNYKFGFKGVLDNIVIDYKSKTFFINDLKTTGKALQDFPESVEYYKYWIQAVMYQQLAWYNYLKDLPDLSEWKFAITFIVIDKYNQIYPFQVSEQTLANWNNKFETEILKILEYHYSSGDFTLPYELALGNITL